MVGRRATLLVCALLGCGDDEGSVDQGGIDGGTGTAIDGGTDAAMDAGWQAEASCGFDQTYRIDWSADYFDPQGLVTFSSPQGYTLDLRGADGGVRETCSMTLPCGGPGVDAEDIALRLKDPAVVALFNDAGWVGSISRFQSSERWRTIERADGKRIRVGWCVEPACIAPAAIRELSPLFRELQLQHGTAWNTCKDWPSR